MAGLDKSYEEAEAARELILDLLNDNPQGLTSKEIGEQLGESGCTIGQFATKLVYTGKITKDVISSNRTLYKPASSNVEEPKKPQVREADKLGDRWLIAWMIDGRGFGEVVTSETDAKTKARKLSADLPGVTIFRGKATKKTGNIITDSDC